MKYLILSIFCSFAFAGIKQAPPAFNHNDSKAVFVDFTSAVYEIEYDYKKSQVTTKTTIKFTQAQDGHPIFDSVNEPSSVFVDNKKLSASLIDVDNGVTKVRVVDSKISKGDHTLVIVTSMDNGGVAFTRSGVSSAFFIKDLTDRKFLEKYVPSNYEYDQYQMTFKVRVVGSINRYNIFSNGVVTETERNYFEVKYPKHYTASSVFYHLVPTHKFVRLRFKYHSISGKEIPVTIYSIARLRNYFFAKKTVKVLKELERDYGPWPHPSLMIYGTKFKGGMEYVGGAVTSLVSLGHELQHSYFAKGVMPANGNSGWMDEAIASWRDKGHQSNSSVNYNSFNLGNHSVYTRKTDDNSYEKGRSFIAYLDYQLKAQGKSGMKDFLRSYFDKRKYTTVTTSDFVSDLKDYSGVDFQSEFDRYVLGINLTINSRSPAVEPKNPHHGHIGDRELRSLL